MVCPTFTDIAAQRAHPEISLANGSGLYDSGYGRIDNYVIPSRREGLQVRMVRDRTLALPEGDLDLGCDNLCFIAQSLIEIGF